MIAVQWRLATHSACLNNKVNKKLSTPKILRVFFNAHFGWYAHGRDVAILPHLLYKVCSVLSHMQWLVATTYTPIKQWQISYHYHVKSPTTIAIVEKTS